MRLRIAGYLSREDKPYWRRARAYLQGRDFVTPEDIMALAGDVLNHRISLSFTARAAGIAPRQAVARLLETVPAP
ncbi:MAG: hypothetical protein ACE5ET_11350 [Gammaproteobacteria bacterium]